MQGNSTFSKEAAVGLSEKCSFGKLREASQKGDSVRMLTIRSSAHKIAVSGRSAWNGAARAAAGRTASFIVVKCLHRAHALQANASPCWARTLSTLAWGNSFSSFIALSTSRPFGFFSVMLYFSLVGHLVVGLLAFGHVMALQNPSFVWEGVVRRSETHIFVYQ